MQAKKEEEEEPWIEREDWPRDRCSIWCGDPEPGAGLGRVEPSETTELARAGSFWNSTARRQRRRWWRWQWRWLRTISTVPFLFPISCAFYSYVFLRNIKAQKRKTGDFLFGSIQFNLLPDFLVPGFAPLRFLLSPSGSRVRAKLFILFPFSHARSRSVLCTFPICTFLKELFIYFIYRI